MMTAIATPSADRPAIFGGKPVCTEPIRFIKPTLPALDTVARTYTGPYLDGTITNAALVTEFERAVAKRLGVQHCVAVSSCTSGLMLTLRAMNLAPGEVILPSFTFFATGHAVRWNGLTPVFADCDANTWTVDPASVESKITNRTRAIIGVHLYGNPCDTTALERIASENGVKLLFDAAHAFGSTRSGRPVGGFGDAEVFSLSPTKLLVAGEGGLVTTNDAGLAHSLKAGRNYGDLGAYDPELLGLNARMTEFNAALGLAGLALVDAKLSRHNQIATSYDTLLSTVCGLRFQQIHRSDTSTYKDYSVTVNPHEFGMTRDQLADALLAENIVTKKYFSPPLHRQELYRAYCQGSTGLPCTDQISDRVLSLPIYESLPDDVLSAIAYAIRRIAAYNA